VLPNALVSRIAISGLITDFPAMTLLRACLLTPRILAPSEMESPGGSRQALNAAPGMPRSFHGHDVFSLSLVVVDQFHIEGVFPFKPENDAPVCPYRHRPETPDQLGLRTETSDL
jgi:hypothetical protein